MKRPASYTDTFLFHRRLIDDTRSSSDTRTWSRSGVLSYLGTDRFLASLGMVRGSGVNSGGRLQIGQRTREKERERDSWRPASESYLPRGRSAQLAASPCLHALHAVYSLARAIMPSIRDDAFPRVRERPTSVSSFARSATPRVNLRFRFYYPPRPHVDELVNTPSTAPSTAPSTRRRSRRHRGNHPLLAVSLSRVVTATSAPTLRFVSQSGPFMIRSFPASPFTAAAAAPTSSSPAVKRSLGGYACRLRRAQGCGAGW